MKSQSFFHILMALVLLITGICSPAAAASQPDAASTPAPVDPACEVLGGTPIEAMERTDGWAWYTGNGAASVTVKMAPGYIKQGFQVDYDLGSATGAYVQIKREYLTTPLDLSAYDHLRFFYKGKAMNTMEVGLVTADGNYFATPWGNVTQVGWWTYGTWDLHDFRKNGQPVSDFSQIRAVFISVKMGKGSAGGSGLFFVDEIQGLKAASRTVPDTFTMLPQRPAEAAKAAQWIKSQQVMPGGLVKSWKEEAADNAWLYDQAMALLVLMKPYPDAASALAKALHLLQNKDGSWFGGYHTSTLTPLMSTSPVGAQAWVVYALAHYASRLPDSDFKTALQTDVKKGADWLAALQRPDGSLPAEVGDATAPTEPNLDAWWAFWAAGYRKQAYAVANFLLDQVWDGQMGRFNASQNAVEILLDDQTWGAAFLRAVTRAQDARRALSYARWMLTTNDAGGPRCGLDGKGPFSRWNEGTMQYAVAQGENSGEYWQLVAAQQAEDGGLPGSPDALSSDLVWLTPMHGVAPTAWFYFASAGSPIPMNTVFLPLAVRSNP